jgi:hypothetical protein
MRRTTFLGFAAVLMLGPSLTWAEPYLAAWKGVNCNACHVNQTGGWLRNGFGKKYGNQLATFDWQGIDNAAKGLTRPLPSQVAFGFDLHESYVGAFFQAPATNVNGFLSGPAYGNYPNGGRQAVEVGVQANDDVSGVLTYRLDDNTPKEIYGLVRNLPLDGYVKFGKFTTPYGLGLADDNSFVREGLGFTFDNYPNEGIEVGLYPNPAFLNVALFNGDTGTSEKAFSGKAGFQGDGWMIAGSLFGQNLDLVTKKMRYGGFGWGRLGPVVLMAEYDSGYDLLTPTTQNNVQAAHISAEGDLGFDCYLRLTTEWLQDSMGFNVDNGYRHLISFRCYPVHNIKCQLDLIRTAPTPASSHYSALGPVEDMVVADAFLFY